VTRTGIDMNDGTEEWWNATTLSSRLAAKGRVQEAHPPGHEQQPDTAPPPVGAAHLTTHPRDLSYGDRSPAQRRKTTAPPAGPAASGTHHRDEGVAREPAHRPAQTPGDKRKVGRRKRGKRASIADNKERVVVGCAQATVEDILARIDKPLECGRVERRYLVQWGPEIGDQKYITRWEKAGYKLLNKQAAPGRPKQYIIQWKPRWECRLVLEGVWQDKLDKFDRTWEEAHAQGNSKRLKRNGAPHDGQGPKARQWRTPNITGPHTHISLQAMDPDTSTHPTGRYELLRGPRPGQEGWAGTPTVVRIQDPRGRLVGTLREDRTQQLWKRWCAARQPGEGTDQEKFARDLASLHARYGGDIKNHWATFGTLMEALHVAHIYTERFASPLNVHKDTRLYYSAHEEDEAFGAVHDAYSAAFLTPSQINPEYTPEQLAKALKHAVQSTSLSDPQLHVLVYPVWRAEPYKKWLRHPRVHQLCRIPRGRFRFIPYDAFTGKERKGKQNWAKWDVDILLVANQEGLDRWYDHDRLQAAIRAAVEIDDLPVHRPEQNMCQTPQVAQKD